MKIKFITKVHVNLKIFNTGLNIWLERAIPKIFNSGSNISRPRWMLNTFEITSHPKCIFKLSSSEENLEKKVYKGFLFFFLNIYNEPWPFKIPLVTLSGFMFFHQYKLTWQGTFKSVITLNSIITSINVIEKLLFVVQGCNTRNLNSVKTQISESELILINSHISIIYNILNYGLNNSTTDMSTSTTYSNYKT